MNWAAGYCSSAIAGHAPWSAPCAVIHRRSPFDGRQTEGVGLNKVGPPRSDVSSRDAKVFVDQSTEDLGPLDGSVAVGTDLEVRDGRQLLQRPMRPMRVVVALVFGQHVDELPLVEDQHPVQALSPDRADPPLGIGVALRSSRWAAQHLDTCVSEDGIEARGELRVAITDQETESVGPLPHRHHEVAGLLGNPLTRRMPCYPENVDPSGPDLKDEEHVD